MVVQPAINPKRASVNTYSRRATIGKGVSTLDDFEDVSANFLLVQVCKDMSEK